jgi:hypothetical protein
MRSPDGKDYPSASLFRVLSVAVIPTNLAEGPAMRR